MVIKNKNVSQIKKQASKSRKYLPLTALLLGLVVVFFVAWKLAGNQSNPSQVSTTESASQNTKGELSEQTQGTAAQSETGGNTNAQPGDTKSNGTENTATLLTPSGNFVSAHHVEADSVLASVCNTTAGATCAVRFTSADGIVKSLNVQTADRGGSAYWNSWTPKSIGITAGTWHISAIATLGGQTQSADDASPLVVAP